MLTNLTNELKQKREELNMSIAEVAKVLRVKEEFIQKLEEGERDFLPIAYIYPILKKYADLLEIPSEDVEAIRASLGVKKDSDRYSPVEHLSEHSSQDFGTDQSKDFGELPSTYTGLEQHQKEAILTDSYHSNQKGRKPNAYLLLAILGVLIISFIATVSLYLYYSGSLKPSSDSKSLPEKINLLENGASAEGKIGIKQTNLDKEQLVIDEAIGSDANLLGERTPSDNTLSIVLKGNSSWIRLLDKNKKKINEFIIRPNQKVNLIFSDVAYLSLGKVQAVKSITLNGAKLDIPKKNGAIRDFQISPKITTNSP